MRHQCGDGGGSERVLTGVGAVARLDRSTAHLRVVASSSSHDTQIAMLARSNLALPLHGLGTLIVHFKSTLANDRRIDSIRLG